MNNPSIVNIPINGVGIGGRLRGLDGRRLKVITKSIAEIGLRTPISVIKDEAGSYILVTGLHRLEACRKLDHTEIAAIVIDMDDVSRELWEVDENLCRIELTTAQKSAHLKRRKELFDKGWLNLFHPGRSAADRVREGYGRENRPKQAGYQSRHRPSRGNSWNRAAGRHFPR
jgi:hypothetical protein